MLKPDQFWQGHIVMETCARQLTCCSEGYPGGKHAQREHLWPTQVRVKKRYQVGRQEQQRLCSQSSFQLKDLKLSLSVGCEGKSVAVWYLNRTAFLSVFGLSSWNFETFDYFVFCACSSATVADSCSSMPTGWRIRLITLITCLVWPLNVIRSVRGIIRPGYVDPEPQRTALPAHHQTLPFLMC